MANTPYFNNTPYMQSNPMVYNQNVPFQYLPTANPCYSQPIMLQQSQQQPSMNYSQPSMQTTNQTTHYSQQDFPPLHDTQNNWQLVRNGKRLRAPDDDESNSSHKDPNEYWLSNNRFSTLTEENTMETNTNNETQKREPKPPPVFVAGVENIKPLIEELDKIAAEKYHYKSLSNEQVKIEPKDSQAYTNTMRSK